MGGFKPKSGKVIAAGLGAVLITVGISIFDKSVVDWIIPMLLVIGAAILITEIGIKKFTNVSSMKSLEPINWISVFIAVVALIFAILSMPLIPFAAPAWAISIAGVSILLLGGMVFIEGLFI